MQDCLIDNSQTLVTFFLHKSYVEKNTIDNLINKSFSPNSIFQLENEFQEEKVDFRPLKLAMKIINFWQRQSKGLT